MKKETFTVTGQTLDTYICFSLLKTLRISKLANLIYILCQKPMVRFQCVHTKRGKLKGKSDVSHNSLTSTPCMFH